MSFSVTMTTTVSRGFCSATDSGSFTDLEEGTSWTSEEFTSRKNTRMVKISIMDTR